MQFTLHLSATSHDDRFWLKASVFVNMLLRLVAPLTSQSPRSWLNAA